MVNLLLKMHYTYPNDYIVSQINSTGRACIQDVIEYYPHSDLFIIGHCLNKGTRSD